MRWTKRIVINFPHVGRGDPELVHRVRNFGEDLYREYRDTRKARISLDEIDAAINRISFEVVSPLRKTAAQFAKTLLKKHGFEGAAGITVEEIGDTSSE
jgi:hypothetical protein